MKNNIIKNYTMKYNRSYIAIILVAFVMFFASCSDSYMENLNTDPSKAATIDPNAQLTTAQLQTYGDLGMMEIYRNYVYAFNQHFMGCWNTTEYGGRHTKADSEMGRIWTSLYPVAIKNLVDAQYRTDDNDDLVNINSAVRIYKVYLISIITDVYGDVPSIDAGKGFLEGIYNPYYDWQEEIYRDFFIELADAVDSMDPSKDRITGDVIYNGDISKWKKFANSLRLRFAMRISDADPIKAQEEFESALQADGGIFESAADDALIKYMNISFNFGQESYSDYRGNALSQLLFGNDPFNNPTYLCSTLFDQLYDNDDPRTFMIARCYYDNDKLMSSTSPEGRIDLTEEMIANNILFKPCEPGAFSYEPWPDGYTSDLLQQVAQDNPTIDVDTEVARETIPKLANNFLRGDNPGVVMTFAEVSFLLAEAKLKNWNVGGASVDDFYKQGVRASMDFLNKNYDCEEVSDADFDTFIGLGIGILPDDKQKEAINTQAWILHLTNPVEGWSNVRRSGYPALKSPAEYGFGSKLVDGQDIPVRLCYPVLESSYNKISYEEALDRMGGTDSWYTSVWWAKNIE